MENNYAQDYGKCNFCGAPKVKSPKTGKVFCSEKCWLKGKPDSYTPAQTKEVQIEKFQENKGESMRLFSSGRDATLIVTTFYKDGTYTDEQIKAFIEMWKDYYYNKIYVNKPF